MATKKRNESDFQPVQPETSFSNGMQFRILTAGISEELPGIIENAYNTFTVVNFAGETILANGGQAVLFIRPEQGRYEVVSAAFCLETI